MRQPGRRASRFVRDERASRPTPTMGHDRPRRGGGAVAVQCRHGRRRVGHARANRPGHDRRRCSTGQQGGGRRRQGARRAAANRRRPGTRPDFLGPRTVHRRATGPVLRREGDPRPRPGAAAQSVLALPGRLRGQAARPSGRHGGPQRVRQGARHGTQNSGEGRRRGWCPLHRRGRPGRTAAGPALEWSADQPRPRRRADRLALARGGRDPAADGALRADGVCGSGLRGAQRPGAPGGFETGHDEGPRQDHQHRTQGVRRPAGLRARRQGCAGAESRRRQAQNPTRRP